MPVRMSKWKTAFLHGLLLIFISYALSAGYDYDYEDQKVDSWGRCPWIRNRLKNGRVRVRSRGRIAKFTCKSGYELVGRKFATCVRGQWNNPIPMCIAKGCPKISAIANGVITEKYKGAQLIFECNPGYSLQGDASIFCDGSLWDKSAPRCDAATAQPQKSCDFEDPDLCGWSHDPTHDFDWRRHQFKTPSGHVGTGPSYDHTFGKGKAGYYMYEETSAPRNANDASRLFSPVYSKNNSPGCFVFWYHMYGATVGSLRIYIKPESHVLVEQTPTWEKSSDQGNQWLRGNVTVPPLNENFQIVIEGIRGTSYLGDIAIDDVNLLKNNCSSVDSSNTTESEEASGDSCRGRCHESDNSTTCGCTVTCESENTCCADYAKLCTESGSETPNGEDESVTGKQETEGTPEDKVGTEYTAVTPILSTEFITPPENQPTVTENVIEKSTKHGVSTVRSNSSWPSTTAVGLNTSTTSQTTIPSTIVPSEHVSVSVATQNTRNISSVTTTTQTIPTTSTSVAVSKAIATIAVTTITTGGPLTTTSSVTSEETTSRKSTTGVLNVTLPVTSEILIVPSTLPSKPPPTNTTREPTTIPTSTTSTTTAKITAAAMPTDAVTTGPPVTNNSFVTQTTSEVPQGEGTTSKSTLPTTAVPTTSRIITTLTTGKILKTSSTIRTIASTSTTSTSVKLTTQVPPKRTWPTRPTRRRPTLPPAIPTTLSTYFINRKTTKSTTVVSVFYKNSVYFTAKSQTTTVDPLKDGTHALKSETVVPKSSSSSVIGASVGVIIIVCLIGGVTFVFLRRRRQKLDKLHDDSIRFLPDNEVIEYSEASATDSLFQS